MSQLPSSTPTRSPLADTLMGFARNGDVLPIRGLQAALIDAAIALDNAATKCAVSESTSRSTAAWIPVSERLPDDPDQQVIVYTSGEFGVGVGVDCYRFGPDGDDWENFGEEVTHWMPLPEAPSRG